MCYRGGNLGAICYTAPVRFNLCRNCLCIETCTLGVTMSLPEEQSEQAQRRWLSRFSKERLDLSASVEDALRLSNELQWEEEEEVESSRQSERERTLIPPRLSLQSKQVPSVRIEGDALSASEMQPEHTARSNEDFKSSADIPRANLLSRMAQRLTSSLSIFGPVAPSEPFPTSPPSSTGRSQSVSPSLRSVSRPVSPTSAIEPMRSVVPSVAAEVGVTGIQPADKVPPRSQSGTGEPPASSVDAAQAEGRRQRLAGHTSKIRLQTAAIPATPRSPVDTDNRSVFEERRNERAEYVGGQEDTHTPAAIDALEEETASTSSHLPTVEPRKQETVTTSAHLPTVEHWQRPAKQEAGYAAFFGSGVFESGQGEVSISHPQVTAESVIHVMLVSNPGPVVVQYISLQPHSGFTIHLTAPIMSRTTFNYVLLQGGF